jgi:hypothetical protein
VFCLERKAPGPNLSLVSGPSHSQFVEESGPRSSKKAGRRLAGAARALNPERERGNGQEAVFSLEREARKGS